VPLLYDNAMSDTEAPCTLHETNTCMVQRRNSIHCRTNNGTSLFNATNLGDSDSAEKLVVSIIQKENRD
jgi:hypothetical protein